MLLLVLLALKIAAEPRCPAVVATTEHFITIQGESSVTFTWQAIVAIVVGIFTVGSALAALGLFVVKLLIRSSLLDNNERLKSILEEKLKVTVAEVVTMNIGKLEQRIELLELRR